MDKVTRGEQFLNRITNDGLISEQGKDWLVVRIDGFHDKQLKNLAGGVDAQTGSSVVRCVKQSTTIGVPSGVAGNWDLHIVQWPWLTATQTSTNVGCYGVSGRTGQVITPAPLATIPFGQVGGLQMFYVPSGTALSITQPVGTSQLVGQLNVPQAYTQGVTRLLSMGFEVHNTTSQLNVQGAACVYRQMSNDNTNVSWTIVDTPVGGSQNTTTFSGPLINYPPDTVQNAMLLPGSRQWEAKDGCYVMAAFFSAEDRATAVEPTCPVIGAAGENDNEGELNTSAVNFPIPGPVVPGTTGVRSMPSFRVFNVHQSGAIFTGLSNSTTLTINWNVFLETFPDPSQADILPLATPSGEYDPDALDLYTRIIADMPVGVPVKENGLGDWFLSAVSDAAKAIGPALSMVPHPAAKIIGGALMAGAPIADSIIAERKQARKAKTANASNNRVPAVWQDNETVAQLRQRPLPPIPQQNVQRTGKRKTTRKRGRRLVKR